MISFKSSAWSRRAQEIEGVKGMSRGQDFSDNVYIPLETYWTRFGEAYSTGNNGGRAVSQITLRLKNQDDAIATGQAIDQALSANPSIRRLHGWRPTGTTPTSPQHAFDVHGDDGAVGQHFTPGRWHRDHEHHAGDSGPNELERSESAAPWEHANEM